MARFVVYEIWTRARVISAPDRHTAYQESEPDPGLCKFGLHLANWHAVPIEGADEPGPRRTGELLSWPRLVTKEFAK